MPDDTGKFMVLVEEGGRTTAPAIDVSRSAAWRIARELRAQGRHVYVMRLDKECAQCVVHGDEPLPEE